jgi:2-hydroxyglutarate dehydrogenase
MYYEPGSLRAKLCTQGAAQMYEYCDEKGIRYERTGKLIVATDASEVPHLQKIFGRGVQNQVPGLKLLKSAAEITAEQPHVSGVMAIHSPNTGIVSYRAVALSYAADIESMGGRILTNFEVSGFEKMDDEKGQITVRSHAHPALHAGLVINCCGLWSDKIAQASGGGDSPSIVPFRGSYLQLTPEARHLVSTNIYPVPKPDFPWLGVHFTPLLTGEVIIGPNALLAFAREGYNLTDVDMQQILRNVTDPGLRRLIIKHWSYGLQEIIKDRLPAFVLPSLQKMVPSIRREHLMRYDTSGVRALALEKDGQLVDDFVFEWSGTSVLNVRNAPSPAATSSLAIAETIVDLVQLQQQKK